jgi:hypothetical protein
MYQIWLNEEPNGMESMLLIKRDSSDIVRGEHLLCEFEANDFGDAYRQFQKFKTKRWEDL